MVVTSPTQKQREKFAEILDKKVKIMDLEIKQLELDINKSQTIISEKSIEKNELYKTLLGKLHEYSLVFSLGWTEKKNLTLTEDRLGVNSTIRKTISAELKLRHKFFEEKTRLEKSVKTSLAKLEKANPGMFRPFEKRRLQTQITEEKAKLAEVRALKYVKDERLKEIQDVLKELDKLEFGSERKHLDNFQKSFEKLRMEKRKLISNTRGEAFEIACVEYVQTERDKRSLAKQARESAAKAEVLRAKRAAKTNEAKKKSELLALKMKKRQNEKLLAEHSELSAKKAIEAKKRQLENLKLRQARAKESCFRKVAQLQPKLQWEIPDRYSFKTLIGWNWSGHPAMENLIAAYWYKSEDCDLKLLEIKKAQEFLSKIKLAKSELEKFDKAERLLAPKSSKKSGLPPRIAVENWEDAEELALRYIRWLGFVDARRSQSGSDEGKDVESSKCVAQVKHMGTGATRPMLQQLYGVASAEKKKPMFFSRSYAKTALEWGDRHGIALFKFDLRGTVTPLNHAAQQLLSE